MCELGACLCNIPNITNKNSYEQQIDQGNKIGLILKKKIERNSPTLHLFIVFLSSLSCKRKKKKKNVSVKYEMRVALYGCGPRILRYCSSAVEGRVKERKRDKRCNGVVGWCKFGVKRNVYESMVEV